MPKVEKKILTATGFISQLKKLRVPLTRSNAVFFKGDDPQNQVLEIRMGDIFKLAKENVQMPVNQIAVLLQSRIYEARMGAISIMDFQARDKKTAAGQKKELFDLYISKHDRINNWDMVDRGAPYIVGGYLFDKPRAILYKLAKSKNACARRTAIVATYFFIRQNQTADTFKIAELLVHDKVEQVNMAVGSWVREAGKRDHGQLISFLDQYAATMPRITLRYAVEKLDAKLKKKYMDLQKSLKAENT